MTWFPPYLQIAWPPSVERLALPCLPVSCIPCMPKPIEMRRGTLHAIYLFFSLHPAVNSKISCSYGFVCTLLYPKKVHGTPDLQKKKQ